MLLIIFRKIVLKKVIMWMLLNVSSLFSVDKDKNMYVIKHWNSIISETAAESAIYKVYIHPGPYTIDHL